MKTTLVILMLEIAVSLTATASPTSTVPVKGDLWEIIGDTNHYKVVWVPDVRYPVNCLTNGTNMVIWREDGPTFVGIAPTNDLLKLVIVPWPPGRQAEIEQSEKKAWLDHISSMEKDGSITNVINLLATSGKICSVRGHAWGSHLHVTLEYSPGRIGCRECKVCGLHQSQYTTDWK